MRSAGRKRRAENEEESVFISMTDMTVSFLFIVMILLAFFASQFRPDELVPKSELDTAVRLLDIARVTINEQETKIVLLEEEVEELRRRLELLEAKERNAVEEYAKAADVARRRIVAALQQKVQEAIPEIEVTISEAGDILRFSGDSFFATGSSVIEKPRIRAVVHALAEGLEELLPCFTLGSRSAWEQGCNPDSVLVDAVQIEGHTDSVGFPDNNLRLSLARGAATYLEAEGHRPNLLSFLNLAQQPVLSVSGYGESRPIAPNDYSGRGLNRRIDLRLIMASVGDAKEIVLIRDQLENIADTAWQEDESQ